MPLVLDAVSCKHQVLFWARFYAALASDALFLGVHLHGFLLKPFGVVAPHTPQGTGFHEKGCPDAWSIVDGESLDVENQCHFALNVATKLLLFSGTAQDLSYLFISCEQLFVSYE
jgi:hypothetical protein